MRHQPTIAIPSPTNRRPLERGRLRSSIPQRNKTPQTVPRVKNNQPLHGYWDADWASTTEDCQSTTGWIFKYRGGPVSWKSRRQHTVALSTTEGEYMAMSDATKEALWLKGIVEDLGDDEQSIKLHYNNMGAGFLSQGGGLPRRTKDIDVRHHFIRDCIRSGEINISYTPTADMVADVLTKPLSRLKHQQAVETLGLV